VPSRPSRPKTEASSHVQLLRAAAGDELLARSYAAALERGYLWHEFGDAELVLP
jgi:S-adenosylmethionine:tRNA ribosyltransferase-isomerase